MVSCTRREHRQERRGSWRDFPSILPHISDSSAGLRSQDVHPSATRIIAPTEVATEVITVGVGDAKADDIHQHFLFSPVV